MRKVVGVLSVLAAVLLLRVPVEARAPRTPRTPRVSCKKIREAVWAGHTLDQILAEFETDAQTVMRCTQKRGKRRARPKKNDAHKSGASQQKASKTDGGASSSSPHAAPPLPLQ